jgi:hypothetical protein
LDKTNRSLYYNEDGMFPGTVRLFKFVKSIKITVRQIRASYGLIQEE